MESHAEQEIILIAIGNTWWTFKALFHGKNKQGFVFFLRYLNRPTGNSVATGGKFCGNHYDMNVKGKVVCTYPLRFSRL